MNYIQLEFEVYQREKMLIFKMDRNSGTYIHTYITLFDNAG